MLTLLKAWTNVISPYLIAAIKKAKSAYCKSRYGETPIYYEAATGLRKIQGSHKKLVL